MLMQKSEAKRFLRITCLGFNDPRSPEKNECIPVSHENVLSWALDGTEGKLSKFSTTDWKEQTGISNFFRLLSPSLTLIPEQHREETEKRLLGFLEPMVKNFGKKSRPQHDRLAHVTVCN